MNDRNVVIDEVTDLYRIIRLNVLRRTPGVSFDTLPLDALPRIDALDRVIHEGGAFSPGSVGEVKRPWYLHPAQDDNLMVLHGKRHVDIYTPAHGKIESFIITPHHVEKDGEVIFDGPAMLVWPRGVFHRVESDAETGSASLNFATHYDGFDIRTNFSIYDLNPDTGEYHVLREGHLDQPG